MEKPHKKTGSRREQKKQATRNALLEAAHRRFHAQGFDGTTLDEILEETGVSKRTFFRYFPSKEELVFPNRARRLETFLTLFAGALKENDPFDAFRALTHLFAAEYTAHREQILAQQQLIATSAALQAREREIDQDWEIAIAACVVKATGPANELDAQVLAGASMGVIRATMRYWYGAGGVGDLDALGQQAIDRLEHGFQVETGGFGPPRRSAASTSSEAPTARK